MTVNSRPNGFTLIEIVITIVIVGIIAGIAAMIIAQGIRAYSGGGERSAAHYQTTLAVERIAREARKIGNCATSPTLTVTANPTGTFSFIDVNGASVTFSVSGGSLFRGVDQLATGITSTQPFSFLSSSGTLTSSCPGIWYVDINVTDKQGAQALQMRTRVHPMNF